MSESYKTFAQFYDELTNDVEYKTRAEYVSGLFSAESNGGKTLLDLACGTGSMSAELSKLGYEITGIDLSEDMLAVAQGKGIPNTVFVKGDMTSFELPYRVSACLCSLDSINHIIGYDNLVKCFKCVYKSLEENGVFIFDVNTLYKHKSVLADNTFIYDEDGYYLVWDNETENSITRIMLDFFIYNGKSYDRYSEEFFEQCYSDEEIKEALEISGFKLIAVYDELSKDKPKEDSQRLYYICKRN